MKTELEPEDIQLIAQRVADLIKPLLSCDGKRPGDELLTPDELTGLLKVKKAQIYAWVNESKYSEDGIPFLKAGKFLRFSKKAVLRWMQKGRNPVEDW